MVFYVFNFILQFTKSNPKICVNCPSRHQCTESKKHQKVVERHVWTDYMDLAEDVRHSPKGKEIYALRAQTIERVFADAKELHGMRYTKLRGMARVKSHVILTFACMNLKKLATWKKREAKLSTHLLIYCFFQILLPKKYFFAKINRVFEIIRFQIPCLSTT